MKKKNPQHKIKVIFKCAEGVSEKEMQRRLNRAYDILFDAVAKARMAKGTSPNSESKTV